MADGKERRIYQITSTPGFTRDGTNLDSGSFVGGQWCRFQRSRPRKIGGYKEISSNISGIVRGAHVYSFGGLEYIYGFTSNEAWVSTTTQFASSSVGTMSTLPSLTAGDNYTFAIDALFDSTGGGEGRLVVHPAKNVSDIADETDTNIYVANIGTNPATFTKVLDGSGGEVMVSGGVVVLQPYVFAYGNHGLIKNSNANQPNNWVIAVGNDANEVNVAGTKIVKGLPYRSGANSPSGLFWSLDSLIRVSRTGSEFRYDVVSAQTTIISPASVVEYDGVYYWIGVDRFFAFDGTVKEIPNQQNLNWFFDNVNYVQRTKIWAYRNTRYGEIWWFFPYGDADECTHAIIFNVREGCWYDTIHGRSAGYSAHVFRYPVLFGNEPNIFDTYSNYVQEFGLNAVQGGSELAIYSNFETSDFGYPTGGAAGEQPTGNDFWTRLIRIEPDFRQVGDMTVTVLGREFAQQAQTATTPYTFAPDTEKIDMREQRRHICLKFESNVIDGDYQMGRVILHTELGDVRS
jgi:hypothetical protein